MRRRNLLWLLLVLPLLAAPWAFHRYLGGLADVGPLSTLDQLMLPVLSLALVVLTLGLGGVLIRNLVKLIIERKRGILGSKLRTKIVFFFLALMLAPTVILFSGSAQVIKLTVEAIVKTPLEQVSSGRRIVNEWTRFFEARAEEQAREVAAELARADLLGAADERLEQALLRLQREMDLTVVRVLEGDRVVARARENPARAVRNQIDGLQGELLRRLEAVAEPGGRIDKVGPGLQVHAIRRLEGSPRDWTLFVGQAVPTEIAASMQNLDASDQAFRQFKAQRRELVRFYVTLLGLICVATLFVATWVGFYLSRRITGPLRELAAATRELSFGDLANAAMAMPVPAFEDLKFKDESEFRYIGKGEIQIYDLRDITTGDAVYGADVRLPGMKYAVIARPPVVGGKIKSVDSTATLAIPGVEQVVEIEGHTPPAKFLPLGGVAVIAANTHAAIAGRDALKIEWDDGPHGSYNTEAYHKEMSATAAKPGKVIRTQGDVDGALAGAAKTFSAEYYQPHMAHIPMEPPAAVANFVDGKMEIWAPVQSPWGTRSDVAENLGLTVDDVTVNVTLLGGGFGRKSKCDYVHEAAILSKELGAPVLVQWTREDDIRHCFYHTTSVERIEAAIDADGKVNGWLHRSVAPSILSTFAEDSGYQFFIEYGMGFVDMPFEIANVRCENGQAMAHTRIGWFRSVSNVPRAFAVQSFAAELANELGRDQKDVLLELIGTPRIIDPKADGYPEDHWNYGEPYEQFPIDTGRLAGVVELAAEKAGWGKKLPEGEGLGIAVHRSFVSYVASVVHVKVEADGTIRVPEVHTAIDCGFAANPERIRSQIEGAAVMGMTLALNSAITYDKGRVVESNYDNYDVARADNFPEAVYTHIVEHPFSVHATGVGEPGVPPFAPALCNAIFNATGKRLRSLPIRKEDITGA